ncbi:MAG: TonB-dependent receptor [Desulfovibrio sp.]|jgi:vitamin B12 transporter|nr:TonB-dependent receptor [Desulfovibrio sp.]
MTKTLAVIAIFALFAGNASPAFAQESEGAQAEKAQAKTRTLETIVVTAGRVEEKAKNVTQSVTVISRAEIEKNQQSDLGTLLRNQGMQVRAYAPGGSSSQLLIRGMRTSLMGDDSQGTILILVNGRRAGTDNVSMIPLVNVDRVEVLRGPAAVQYGSSAIGGVVNIITRRGDKLHAAAEAGLSSWGGVRTLGELSGSGYGFDASGGISWVTQNDSYRTGRGNDLHTYHNTDMNYNLAQNLNLGYTFLEEHRIGVNYQSVKQDNVGSPGDINGLTPDDRMDRQNYSVDFTYEGGYKDAGLTWMGRYFTGEYKYDIRQSYLDYFGGYPVSARAKDKNEYRGAQGQLTFSNKFLSLTGGVDWLKSDRSQFNRTVGPFTSTSLHNDNIIQTDLGLFALAKLTLFDNLLIISGGLRHDVYESEYEGSSKHYYRTTPSVGLAVNPLDWLTLRSNYAESFSVPHTLAVTGYSDAYSTYLGNKNLKPEKAKSWDIGAEIHHQSLHLGLSYFMTNYKDKIISETISSWPSVVSQYVNLPGISKFRGIELDASYDVGELFDLPFAVKPYVNLTHLFKYDDPDGEKVMFVSATNMTYGINFNHPDWGLDVDLRFNYMGRQKITETKWPSPTNGQPKYFGGDTTADLYVSKVIHKWDDYGTLSVKGEIRNIFDHDYAAIDYYPMPGRSFYIGLRYDY